MNQQGTIKKIEGRNVFISFAPLACCSGSGGVCHCADATAEVEFKALNNKGISLSLGDYVEVSTPSGAAWGGVIRLLVVPAVLLLAGWLAFGVWAGAGAAVAGLLFSILFPQNPDTGFPKVERIVPVGDFTPFTAQA